MVVDTLILFVCVLNLPIILNTGRKASKTQY